MESAPQPRMPEEEDREDLNRTRFGLLACLMFMAGGLYWTASVGLLTLSALKAYPVMIAAGGALIACFVLGATFWTTRNLKNPRGANRTIEGSDGLCLNAYDEVTGLPTRRLFDSLLKQALSRARTHGHRVAVLLIEMDHMTLTTELQGRGNRNLIYRVKAARIKSALRTTDSVARLAEYTFGILLDQVMHPEEVAAAAKKIQASLSMPYSLNGHEIFLSSRIGLSLSTLGDDHETALLESAAEAVAQARAEGYGLYGLGGAVMAPRVDPTSTMAA